MTETALALDSLDAVVFDFDGVILESAAIKGAAFQELFAEYPEHLDAIRKHHLQNLGVSRFDKFAWIYDHLFNRPLLEDESRELGMRYSRLVFDRTACSPFVPGAPELLECLCGRLPLFVASATPQPELEAVIERRDLTRFFVAVHGSPPSKDELLSSIVHVGPFEPNRVLMIGDGISDLRAALTCGCRFVARLDEAAPPQPFPVGTPRVRTLAELQSLLC